MTMQASGLFSRILKYIGESEFVPADLVVELEDVVAQEQAKAIAHARRRDEELIEALGLLDEIQEEAPWPEWSARVAALRVKVGKC